jgi:hypothetical protein
VSRIKTLKRLTAVRTRMRDAAAASAAQAAQREHLAREARDMKDQAIVDLDSELLQKIAVARPELALELFQADRQQATGALNVATQEWHGRQGESHQARSALGLRERALQVAEKLLDEARALRNERIGKYEQATADDLSAGRSSRRKS